MTLKPKIGDFVILFIILSIAVINLVIFMQKPDGNATALIIKDGKVIQRIELDRVKERIEIRSEGKYNNLIVAENGRIHFEESDCPDDVCVKTGWISRPGQVAVCLPAGVIIKIVGESNDTDIILK